MSPVQREVAHTHTHFWHASSLNDSQVSIDSILSNVFACRIVENNSNVTTAVSKLVNPWEENYTALLLGESGQQRMLVISNQTVNYISLPFGLVVSEITKHLLLFNDALQQNTNLRNLQWEPSVHVHSDDSCY